MIGIIFPAFHLDLKKEFELGRARKKFHEWNNHGERKKPAFFTSTLLFQNLFQGLLLNS